MLKGIMSVTVGLVAMSLCVGCASSSGPAQSEPAWINKGGRAFPEDAGKAYYAVGVANASKVPDLSLRRTAASERARTEMARIIRVRIEGMVKNYQESTKSASMDKATDDSLVGQTARTIVDESLSGSEIHEIWNNDRTGECYALVRLPFDNVAKQARECSVFREVGQMRG
jgi:hypothetical protein